jgi:hypothetical protein
MYHIAFWVIVRLLTPKEAKQWFSFSFDSTKRLFFIKKKSAYPILLELGIHRGMISIEKPFCKSTLVKVPDLVIIYKI